MSTKESRLLRFLADELSHLELLESFTIQSGPSPADPLCDNVKVVFYPLWSNNTKDALTAMHDAVGTIVRENLPELIQTAVANQRVKVQEAREALYAFHNKPADTPLDEKALDQDEAAGFAGSIDMAGAERVLGNGSDADNQLDF